MRTQTFGTRTLERRSTEGASFPPIRDIEWAGDTYSYVDVYFDAPFRSLVRGEDFAPFVRYRWVPGSFVVLANPAVDIANAALPAQVPIGQATSIRHYDRGACSADVSWRAIARGLIEEGLDVEISEMGTGYSVLPSGNWVLTPVLRPEFLDISLDAFRIYRRYDVSIANVFGGSFEIRLLAGFRTSDQRLRFVLEDVSARVDPQLTAPDLVGSAADLETRLTTEFPAAVNARLPEIVGQVVEVGGDPLLDCNPCRGLEADRLCFDLLPGVLQDELPSLGPDALEPRNVACLPTDGRGACGILPNFHRVHGRPEGIEAVLSEWSPEEEEAGRGEADPLYPVLREAGACDRSSAPERPVEAGYFGSIFEIPPAGTPLPFGDAP